MSYAEWLRASGIAEKVIRPAIREHYPEVARRMTKMWEREDAVPIVGEMKDKRSSHDRPGWLQRHLQERSDQLQKVEREQARNSSVFYQGH